MGRDIELRSVEQLAEIGACHAVMMELRPHLKDAGSFVRQVMRQRERHHLGTLGLPDIAEHA